jgi:hypothetical protein
LLLLLLLSSSSSLLLLLLFLLLLLLLLLLLFLFQTGTGLAQCVCSTLDVPCRAGGGGKKYALAGLQHTTGLGMDPRHFTLNLVRNPFEMVVSGLHYHRTTAHPLEAWLCVRAHFESSRRRHSHHSRPIAPSRTAVPAATTAAIVATVAQPPRQHHILPLHVIL